MDALRIGLEWDLHGELSDPREREISPSIAGNCDFIKERTRLSCLQEYIDLQMALTLSRMYHRSFRISVVGSPDITMFIGHPKH